MSEPKGRARTTVTIAPGILNWSLVDDRIGGARSDSHALRRAGKAVLIDPLPLGKSALAALGKVEAICLTGSCHQRSAWRYRELFGAEVYAPRGAEGLEEAPDVWYRKGDLLPGGLRAVHAPGPAEVHYAFHLARGRGALFCADVLVNDGKRIGFVPGEYQDDPARTRRTARSFLKLRFGILCFDHGPPLTKDPRAALREVLERDKGR